MRGWIICKLRDEGSGQFDDLAKVSPFSNSGNGKSLSSRVFDLSYGTLSLKDQPPSSGWVFLAKDASISTVAKCFSEEELVLAPVQPIKLDHLHINDESVLHRDDPSSGLDGYIVSNSPIHSINGTYLKAGVFDNVAMYAHVRGWVILRDQFPEIPELGITTADIEDSAVGFNKFFLRAEAALHDIVDTNNPIPEGSSEFTRKFLDIARAGNKMITADQTLQNLHNSDRRIALSSQFSVDMEVLLSKMQSSFTTTLGQSSAAIPSNTMATSAAFSSTALDSTTNDTKEESKSNSVQAPLDVDLNMVLTKHISYQSTYTALSPQVLHNSMPSQSVPAVWSAEAELSTEVIACVERREMIYKQILMVAHEMQTVYLEHGIEVARMRSQQFEDLLQDLRSVTLDLAEAYGAWSRVVIKQEAVEKKKGKKKVTKMYAHEPDTRTYCVVIGFRSVHELFPASQAVQSGNKKFCRGYEVAVKGMECKFVGEYPTERDAVEALEEAFRGVPEEQWLEVDMNAERKAIVGYRPCGKHFIVRSGGVPPDIPCEACGAAKAANTDTIAPKLYKFINGFPVFSYSNVNYIEKVWKDMTALEDIDVVRKLFPSVETFKNPFYLDSSTRTQLLNTMLVKDDSDDVSFSRHRKAADPLGNLKGRMEILQDALLYSKTYQAEVEEKKKTKKISNHPLFKTQQVPKIFEDEVKKLESTGAKVRKSTKTGTIHSSASTSSLADNTRQFGQTLSLATEIHGIRAERYIAALKVLSQVLGSDYAEKPVQKDDQMQTGLLRTSSSAPSTATHRGTSNHASTANAKTNSSFRGTGTGTGYAGIAVGEDDEEDENYMDDMDYPDDLKSLPVQAITAVFSDRGADFFLDSTRPLPAYREDDMFCRTDVGEFAHFTKGRSVKQFNYQQDTYKQGKIKEKRRKQLQAQLRHAVQQRFTAEHIDYVHMLIDQAKEVRGSVLQLDIIQAESYIMKYHTMIKNSIMVQSMYRGNKDRMFFYRLREQYVRDQVHRKYTAIFAFNTAQNIVPELVNGKMLQHKKERSKRLYTVVVNMSGFLCVVSIYRGARQLRKPTSSLCASCNTKSATYFANEDVVKMAHSTVNVKKYRDKFHGSKPIPKHMEEIRVKDEMYKHVFDIEYDGKPWAQRNPCTCKLLQEVENWRVGFYFPLDRKTTHKTYKVEEVVKLLLFIEGVKCMQEPSYAYSSLVGGTFDYLTPLFGPRPPQNAGSNTSAVQTMDFYCSASYSKAWVKAAKESSVLPRLVTQLPDNFQNVLKVYQGSSNDLVVADHKPYNTLYYLDRYMVPDISDKLEIEPLLAHGYTNHGSSSYHESDVNSAESLVEKEKPAHQRFIDQWQPLWELERIKLVIKRTSIILLEQQQKLMSTDKELSGKVVELNTCNTALERASMAHEDRMSLLQRIQESIQLAEKRNKEVMQYSKELFAFTENLERNVGEDWTRSYDKLEEAHLWEDMHRKHQLELLMARELMPISEELVTIGQSFQSVQELQRAVNKLQGEKSLLTTIVCNINRELEYLQKAIVERQNNMFKAIRLMFHVYSYKRHFVLGRNINIFPINLVFIRQPELRLKPEYRKMLSAVLRQVITLQKHNISTKKVVKLDGSIEVIKPSALVKSQHTDDDIYIRCLVSLYIDEVSRAFVITVQGNYNHIANKADIVTTEESCQHLDFGLEKEQYSPMLLLSNVNDIIITREEVNMLLKRDARHYHIAERVARLRPPTDFKAPSTFDRDVQYARNLAGRHKFIHLSEANNEKIMTYKRRQADLDSEDVSTAKKLLEHIRLNIFSNRVCIGMVHLYRRVVQFDKIFRNCLYYNDLMSHNPVNIQHDLYNNICKNRPFLFHNNTRLLVNFYQYLHKFTVNLHFLSVDTWLPVYVNVDMQLETLLASLLGRGTVPLSVIMLLKAFTTVQYSSTFIDYVLRSLAITLPGQLTGYHNRSPLAAEIPTLTFNLHHITSYKFLISFYRFMLNTYLYIKVFRNHLDDVYFEIYKPNNGKFYFHSYEGNVIKLYVSHSDVLLMLLKAARLELLHPDNVMDLINYLLDSFVYIDFKEVASGYVQSVDSAQSRPSSRYQTLGNPQQGLQSAIPLSIADANDSPAEEMFLHLYDHYIRSTTPLPIPPPSPLLPAMNSRFIMVNSLPGLSKSESLIVDVHALKFYLCHTFDMFNKWKEMRFDNFPHVPNVSADTIQKLLKQVNAFTSYPQYILHPTKKASQGNLQMINVYTSIYPFKLKDTKETADQGASTHLFTAVYLSDDKDFVKVKISNLNHKVHGKEIEDMSLKYDREAFYEEDLRSRQVIEYYLYKKKVEDMHSTLVGGHLHSLKRFKSFVDDVIARRLRDLSYEMLQHLAANANKLIAKSVAVNLLFLLLPESKEHAKSVELQRDVRLVSNGPNRFSSAVQDVVYGLFAASGLKQQVVFSQLDLSHLDLLVVYTDACYSRLASRQHHAGSLMKSSVKSYQALREHKEKAYFDNRHPDFWSKPAVKRDRKKSRRRGLYVYEDRHFRMVRLNNQDYMLRSLSVSNYGILILNLYHLDSSRDLLVHAFPKLDSPKEDVSNSGENDFVNKLSSSIDKYAKEISGDALQVQLNQIGTLTQRIVKSVAESVVQGIIGTCAALIGHTQLVSAAEDEEILSLKQRLLPHKTTQLSRVNSSLHHRFISQEESFSRANLHSKPRNAFLFPAPKYKEIMSEKEYRELMAMSVDEPVPLPVVATKHTRRRSTVRQNRRQSIRGSKSLAIKSISESSVDENISQAIEEAVNTVTLGSYCALFVPLDQGIAVTPLYVRPGQETVVSVLESYLHLDAQDYLNGRIPELSRVTLTHAIAYYISWPTGTKSSERQRNERYYRLQEHLQAKVEVQEGEFNSGDVESMVCNGDVLLLFRHNKDGIFQKIQNVCHDYMQQYLPILALRREREGREHEYRVNVYSNYKQVMSLLAEQLEPQMNAIFNPKTFIKVQAVEKSLQHVVLQLLRWFDDNKTNLNETVYEMDGDFFFLGDSYLLQQQPSLFLMFDAALSEISYQHQGQFIHHPYVSKLFHTIMNRDYSADANDKEVVPTYFSPDQVVYAIYQQHCYRCDLPYSVCRFPGCSHVRSMSRAALGGDLWLNEHSHGTLPELLKYCGKYPLDTEIKQFIFSHKLLEKTQHLDYLIKQFYASYHEGYDYQSVEKECQLEDKIDAKAYYNYHYQHFLTCRYEDLNAELHYLDILQRILLLPETVAMKHSVTDCLLAEGGIDYERKVSEIHDLLDQVRNKHHQQALRHLLQGLDIRIQSGYHGVQHAFSLSDKQETANIETGKISVKMMQRIVASVNADPYPYLPSSEVAKAGSKGPMPEELYQLLMQRVVVIVKPSKDASDLSNALHRSLRQHGGKDYQAIGKVLTSDKSSTAFKRLLQEEVVKLPRQELLVVQILYGIMTQQELLISHDRGVPTASLAYIPTDEFEDRIKPGLTVSVYDVHSRVTRAVYLNQSQIQQLVGIFNTFFSQQRSANNSTYSLNASRNSMRATKSFALPPHLNIYSKNPAFPSPLNANDFLHTGQLIAFYSAYLLKIQRVGNFCTGVELNMFALDGLFNKKAQADAKGVGGKGSLSLNSKLNYFQPLGKGSFKVQKISHDINGLLDLASEMEVTKEVF